MDYGVLTIQKHLNSNIVAIHLVNPLLQETILKSPLTQELSTRLRESSVEEIPLHFLVRSFTKIGVSLGILSIPLLGPCEVLVLIGFQD